MTAIELTPGEHEHSAQVEEAAIWFADQHPRPAPPIPALRDRFGLTPLEAVEAIRMADRMQMLRRAFG